MMMSASNFAAPAYGTTTMPPPPPTFESSQSGSHGDLSSMDSPMYSDSAYSTPGYVGTPVKNAQVNLDFSKFKTKLCRHYLMGNPCPFEDRCAFAHGHDEQALARQAALALAPRPPAYDFAESSSEGDDAQATVADTTPAESRPNTPPAYPTRYRYDPYTPSGMIFAN